MNMLTPNELIALAVLAMIASVAVLNDARSRK